MIGNSTFGRMTFGRNGRITFGRKIRLNVIRPNVDFLEQNQHLVEFEFSQIRLNVDSSQEINIWSNNI